VILLISASWAARITGVRHWHMVPSSVFLKNFVLDLCCCFSLKYSIQFTFETTSAYETRYFWRTFMKGRNGSPDQIPHFVIFLDDTVTLGYDGTSWGEAICENETLALTGWQGSNVVHFSPSYTEDQCHVRVSSTKVFAVVSGRVSLCSPLWPWTCTLLPQSPMCWDNRVCHQSDSC
jgi:hypothetical protein